MNAMKSNRSALKFLTLHLAHGFSLIELMVAIAIGSFMVLGLAALTSSTQATYSTQTQLSQLSDKQRFASMVLTNTIQTAGYFTLTATTANNTAATSLPAWSSGSAFIYAAGQFVAGSSGVNASTPDSFAIRYEMDSGDPLNVLNCQGGTNTGATNLVYENVFSVSGNILSCSVGATAGGASVGTAPMSVPLIDGVQNMKVWYGVDTAAAGATPMGTPTSVTQYIPASSMTANQWQCVLSIMIVLTFVNPVPGTSGATTTTYTTVVRVM